MTPVPGILQCHGEETTKRVMAPVNPGRNSLLWALREKDGRAVREPVGTRVELASWVRERQTRLLTSGHLKFRQHPQVLGPQLCFPIFRHRYPELGWNTGHLGKLPWTVVPSHHQLVLSLPRRRPQLMQGHIFVKVELFGKKAECVSFCKPSGATIFLSWTSPLQSDHYFVSEGGRSLDESCSRLSVS